MFLFILFFSAVVDFTFFFFAVFFNRQIRATCQIWARGKETSRLNFTATNVFFFFSLPPLYLPAYVSPSHPPFVLLSCVALPHFQANPFIIFHQDNKTALFFFPPVLL